MLCRVVAFCLLSAAYARVPLRPRELELAWPFGQTDAENLFTTASGLAPYIRTFKDQCMLWDSSCSGNRTLALDEFFNNSGTMKQLVYGGWEYWAVHREKSGIAPDLNSKILNWMRQPDCRSSFLEWHSKHPDESSWPYTDWVENTNVPQTLDWSSLAISSGTAGCCDACELVGGNVDVFYWPVPGANTDCLASIGTTVASDIDQNLVITDARDVGGGWWESQPNPYQLTSSLSLSNPALPRTINARGHALLSESGNGSESGTIAIQNGFTFTYPSIYVGFSSMYAVDRCGPIGTYIPYTMLAFTPGELSTIQWPVWDRGSIPPQATKSFNFADLPCPPPDVMLADQYKPAPGSPYRPVLSPPEQIYRLQPGWSKCVITHAFAGIDPPKSLTPAAALAPNLTPTSSQSDTAETTSSSSLEPLSRPAEAGVTGATRDPPTPAHKVQTAGPRSTPNPLTSSTAKPNSNALKSSLDPQGTRVAEADSQLKGLEALEAFFSLEAASESQTSSKKAQESTFQDPSKDGSSIATINTVIPQKISKAPHISRTSSGQRSDMKSSITVISDPLATHGVQYENGASIPLEEPNESLYSDDGHTIASDPKASHNHSSLIQESESPQGTTTLKPGLPEAVIRLNSGISTAYRNPADGIQGNTDGPSSRVVADLATDTNSVPNSAWSSNAGFSVESPTYAALSYSPLPKDQGTPQPQYSSSGPVADRGPKSTSMLASKALTESKPDSSLAVSAISPRISMSNPNAPEGSAHVTLAASNESYNTNLDPLPTLSDPSLTLYSTPSKANAVHIPQSKPSNINETIPQNQTRPALIPTGISTAEGPARPSSQFKNPGANSTVVPFGNGGGKRSAVCFIYLFVSLASFFFPSVF